MENNEGIIVLKLCLAGIQPMYYNFCNRNIPKKIFLENVAKMDFILIETEKSIFAKIVKNELYELFSKVKMELDD